MFLWKRSLLNFTSPTYERYYIWVKFMDQLGLFKFERTAVPKMPGLSSIKLRSMGLKSKFLFYLYNEKILNPTFVAMNTPVSSECFWNDVLSLDQATIWNQETDLMLLTVPFTVTIVIVLTAVLGECLRLFIIIEIHCHNLFNKNPPLIRERPIV